MVFVLEAVMLTELNTKGLVRTEELNVNVFATPFAGVAVVVIPKAGFPFLAVKRIGDAPL
jgi:hypothetical protein